jgi:hypothetical protein
MHVEQHGGTLKLVSKAGEGTRVVIRFPKERSRPRVEDHSAVSERVALADEYLPDRLAS